LHIKTSLSRTGSGATSSGRIVSIGVLEGPDVGEETLVSGGIPGKFDGNYSISNRSCYVYPFEDSRRSIGARSCS